MKKIFAGLLIGTMALATQVALFANTNNEVGVATLGATVAVTDAAPTGSVEATKVTEAQVAAINENEQKEMMAKIKKVCETEKYDYDKLLSNMEKGTLSEEEKALLEKVGIIAAIPASIPAVATQLEGIETTKGDRIEAIKIEGSKMIALEKGIEK